jgi:hypothetical protein
MAKGQTASKTVTLNNMPTSTISKIMELIVVNDQLVPDRNLIEPGVNSATNKN